MISSTAAPPVLRHFTVAKVGVFRFVEDLARPAEALQAAIEKAIERGRGEDPGWDIAGSLIVVPEAFNLGRLYERSDQPPAFPAETILKTLRSEFAGPLRMALIASVLCPGRMSSAYWVDADGAELMCHKVTDDRTGLYAPCPLVKADIQNPIACANAEVGALICLDAFDLLTDVRGRRQALRARLTGKNRIICVSAQATVVGANRQFPTDAEECWYAIADGNYKDPSFVAAPDDRLKKRVDADPPEGNAVKLLPLF